MMLLDGMTNWTPPRQGQRTDASRDSAVRGEPTAEKIRAMARYYERYGGIVHLRAPTFRI